MANALDYLQEMRWRDVVYPVTKCSVHFTHDGVRHRIQYRDGVVVDQLGVDAIEFEYELEMREDLFKGPYRNMFVRGLSRLFRDMYEKKSGELFDPVYGGPFTVVPVRFEESRDPSKRDGVTVNVTFCRTLSTDELDSLPDNPSLAMIAGLITSQAGELDKPAVRAYPDVLTALENFGQQLEVTLRSPGNQLDNISYKAKRLEQRIDSIEGGAPGLWGIRDSSRSVRDASVRLAARGGNPVDPLVKVVIPASKSVAAVAAEQGMAPYELLKLNPILARTPLIPPGTEVLVRPRGVANSPERRR